MLTEEAAVPATVDVQQRIRDVMTSLGLSINKAADAAEMNAGQLSRILNSNKPGPDTLQRLGVAWGVEPFVFLMTAEEAEPYVEAAKSRREKLL